LGKISRRDFLVRAAVVAGATPALLAACQQPAAQPTAAKPAAGTTPAATAAKAPAVIKGTTLNILEGTYFIAPAQDLFKKLALDWGKENGVTVNVDFLNWPDLQPKIGAAVQAGGVDIVELWPSWNVLYKDNLVDVTDIAEAVGKAGGGWEDYVLNTGKVNDKYPAMPIGNSGGTVTYRISMFKDVGVANADDGMKLDMTWDEYHAIGKKLKAKGKPFGQALGHSTGDPWGVTLAYMWSHGAMEVEKDGKTVAFNKPEFVDGMKKFVQAWKDAYDETGLSWDDSSNNRAYLAEQLSCTHNGSSIYFAAKKDKPDIAKDTHHMLNPKGPAGRFYWFSTRTLGILNKSKNVEGAKEFIKWFMDDKQFDQWFTVQDGYQLQHVKKYANHALWQKDPKMQPYREVPKYGRDLGYAGPANEKAALAYSKYIIVDTFAKAVQTGDAEGAIKWGVEELKKIYS
jgi:multiple sugar transport system substrate-binding protein